VGLSPDGSTTYCLPRRIGLGRALELRLLNRALSAQEALQWGLANRVDHLEREAHSVAAQLAAGPTRAIATMTASEDAHEAIGAFKEKRIPVFRGR